MFEHTQDNEKLFRLIELGNFEEVKSLLINLKNSVSYDEYQPGLLKISEPQ